MTKKLKIIYDPPSGWRYGFPREYIPRDGKSIQDILIEDGYPVDQVEFAAKHTRFWCEEVKDD